ncbi:MAG: hypothetical protein IPO67_23730 [Deltaproteobacteria bacterium]|nr:hypothetical protein [Deltaproteobacteria bacterium]
MRLLLPLGLLSVVAGCAAPVQFTCLESDPLCDIVAVLSDERPAATGVDIVGLAAYQGVEHWILKDGEEMVDEVRLVAGRETVFRVFIEPHDDFISREITARVYVFQSGKLAGRGPGEPRAPGPLQRDRPRLDDQRAHRGLGHGRRRHGAGRARRGQRHSERPRA